LDRSRRYNLKNVINKCREILEDDFKTRLRYFGIFCDKEKNNIPTEKLTHLSSEEKEVRRWLDNAILEQKKGILSEKDAVKRYIRHCSFTFLNRLAALRAMEVRGLITETIFPRDEFGGRSLRGRKIKENHLEWSEERTLKETLNEAFLEVSQEIKILFDINDEYSFIFPTHRACLEVINLLSFDVTEEDWKTDEILGWIYQYFNSQLRDELPKERKRHPLPDDIPVKNQFYTPKWIVKLLVENTLGRLFLEMHPDSSLVSKWKYYVRYNFNEARGNNRKLENLSKIRILDPACGSGHFLMYSFDVLVDMYKEVHPDLTIQEILSSILENNLFGIDIDLRAIQIAALNIYLKVKTYDNEFKIPNLNLICADARISDGKLETDFLKKFKGEPKLQELLANILSDLNYTFELGSIIKIRGKLIEYIKELRKDYRKTLKKYTDEKPKWSLNKIISLLNQFEEEALDTKNIGELLFYLEAEKSLGLLNLLSQKYDIILMNPPYGTMPENTKKYVDKNYKYLKNDRPKRYYSPKHDYYATFIMASYELLKPKGYLGMLTQRSHLFLKYFTFLRQKVFQEWFFPQINVDLGFGILDEATTRTAATILYKAPANQAALFCDLTGIANQDDKEQFYLQRINNISEKPWFERRLEFFNFIPGSPFIYWIPQKLIELFNKFPCLDRDRAFRSSDEKIADCVVGLQTGDDPQFVRFFWEVNQNEIPSRWVVFSKRGQSIKYYNNNNQVVFWENNGESIENFPSSRFQNKDYYLQDKVGMTWPLIASSDSLNVQVLSKFSVFDVGSSSLFLIDEMQPFFWEILGILNSKLNDFIMPIIDPLKHNRHVGYISKIPIALENLPHQELKTKSKTIFLLKRDLDTTSERSTIFIAPSILQILDSFSIETRPITSHPHKLEFEWSIPNIIPEAWAIRGKKSESLRELSVKFHNRKNMIFEKIKKLQDDINDIVFNLYDLSEEDVNEIEENLKIQDVGEEIGGETEFSDEKSTTEVETELSKMQEDESNINEAFIKSQIVSLISYYVKRVMDNSDDGIIPINLQDPNNLYEQVIRYIENDFGSETLNEKLSEIKEIFGKGLEEWLAKDYFKFHIEEYLYRPIYWQLCSYRYGRSRNPPGIFSCLIHYQKLNRDIIPKVQAFYVIKLRDKLRQQKDKTAKELRDAKANDHKSKIKTLSKKYEQVSQNLDELEKFNAALNELHNPREKKTKKPKKSNWVIDKIAEIRDNGWTPVIDYGVRVNIEPLKELNLLPTIADKVK